MLERRALDETIGGTATAPFFESNLRTLPWAANSVRALIPTVKVDSSPVLAIRQKTRTNNADVVAPSATKPTTVLGVERVEVDIKVVAHVSEPIDRMLLMDSTQLETFLTNEMRLGVLAGTEDQLLNGDGLGNNFEGLLAAITASETVGAFSEIDTIMKAIGTVRANLYEPDAIVVSQDDYEKYYGGGPFDELLGDRLWGKRLVVSPMLAAGIGIVGAFEAGATVYDRMQARVDWAQTGYVDATPDVDLFTTNQVRARGEERLGFLVHRPSAFCKVDFIP